VKQDIAIVWLKRDLRFTDHEALYFAQKQSLPILLVYFFEPSIMDYADSDIRHWRFVYQSLQEMQSKLSELNAQIYIFHQEAINVFEKINEKYNIKYIFSHQETGNKLTYDRDLLVKQFCLNQSVDWKEYQQNGVVRKLKSRKDWEQRWKQKMSLPPKIVDEKNWNFLLFDNNFYNAIKGPELKSEIITPNTHFQPGGEINA